MKLNCPICNSNEVRKYRNKVWDSENCSVMKCLNCEFFFLDPMMEEEKGNSFYANYSKYLSKRIGKEKETTEQTFERRKRMVPYRLDIVKPYLAKDYRVLEIGGGCGNFIGEIYKSGYISEAFLIEPCIEHLTFACNYYGINGYKNLDEIKNKKFNVIVMFHVLEHLRNPQEFLCQVFSLLTNNGFIVIEVPCSADPLLSLYNSNDYKDFYFQSLHPYVYSQTALKVCFENAGYKSGKFIYYQRYSLSNHLFWLSKGKPGGSVRFSKILGNSCELAYKESMERNKTTDTIFGVFQRK